MPFIHFFINWKYKLKCSVEISWEPSLSESMPGKVVQVFHYLIISRNHQYRSPHDGLQRYYSIQDWNFRICLISHRHCIQRIRFLLWSHQTRTRPTFPCSKRLIKFRLGKIAFQSQSEARTIISSKTSTRSTKSRTGSKPFNLNNDPANLLF